MVTVVCQKYTNGHWGLPTLDWITEPSETKLRGCLVGGVGFEFGYDTQ